MTSFVFKRINKTFINYILYNSLRSFRFDTPKSRGFCQLCAICAVGIVRKLDFENSNSTKLRGDHLCSNTFNARTNLTSVTAGARKLSTTSKTNTETEHHYCKSPPDQFDRDFEEGVGCNIEEPMPHTPVLLRETIDNLDVRENGIFLDMTFGAGGHSRAILERSSTTRIFALDRDPLSAEYVEKLRKEFPNRVFGFLGKFSDLPRLLSKRGIAPDFFHGALMDLGASSMQFNTPSRGFMISQDGPLDMRMDGNRSEDQPTAAQILEHIDEFSLYRVLKYYGQDKRARMLARAIIEARLMFKTFRTTRELADFVSALVEGVGGRDMLNRYSHPATKTFQALRIFVNNEMNELDYGLRVAHRYLKMDGKMAVIAFHSLEDTIAKRHFTGTDIDATPDTLGGSLSKHRRPAIRHVTQYTEDEVKETMKAKPWEPIFKHVLVPSSEEVHENPRSRSARLRVARKIRHVAPSDY